MGLLAFSALTIDLGALWVARGAGAECRRRGALAGGVSLAYVNPTDVDSGRRPRRTTVALQHRSGARRWRRPRWRRSPGPCPAGSPAVPGDCLQVAVARGAAPGRRCRSYFSRLFGVAATDVARLRQRQGHDRQRDALPPAAGDRRSLGSEHQRADRPCATSTTIAGTPNLPPGTGDTLRPADLRPAPASGDVVGRRVDRRRVARPGPAAAPSTCLVTRPAGGSSGDREQRYRREHRSRATACRCQIGDA